MGDFGGFNGAIIVIQMSLMGIYNSLMFKAELTKEVQVRKPRNRKVQADGSQQQQDF